MEILVLSDSHDRVDHMVRAVEQFHPRQVLHLGDLSLIHISEPTRR